MYKQKKTSLLIVIDSSGLRACNDLSNIGHTFGADHLLVLNSEDFVDRLSDPSHTYWSYRDRYRSGSYFELALTATGVYGPDQIKRLAIIGANRSAKLLRVILEKVSVYLIEKASISIAGFVVDATTFDFMTEKSEDVELYGCRLADSWWRPSQKKRICSYLRFHRCLGKAPMNVEFGHAAWPELNSLAIWEDLANSHLSPKESLDVQPDPENKGQISAFTPSLAKAFWHPDLTSVNLVGCATVEWLTDFPCLPKLEDYSAGDTPTSPDLLNWLCANPSIDDMSLAWPKDTKLPWHILKRLKGLRYLNVSSTHLTDDDLRLIASSTRLRTVYAFYTSVTAACWNTVLNWPSLRSFWTSTEAMLGQLPTEYPETVKLKEVVAMNALVEPFEALLARYPNVKLTSM